MPRDRIHFALINAGHFLDHLTTLVFATAAALVLSREWGLSYAELIPYATPGFVAFGVFSLPSGWLADRWSREGMMVVFFVGLGLACVATAFANSPLQIGLGLFVLGMFAAIYHPVGLALLVQGRPKAGMAIAVNGVYGNLGVGSAALITGYFIDNGGWRVAFVVPGIVSILCGIAYLVVMRRDIAARNSLTPKSAGGTAADLGASPGRAAVLKLSAIIFFTTAISGLIFQSVSFALPKILEERVGALAGSATNIGWLAFLVFAFASLAQLVCGRALDRYPPRNVFMTTAAIQCVFFALMPGLTGWTALSISLGFMIGVFGQVPIIDFLIGRMAKSELRSQIYGARYVLSFLVIAAALPLLSWIYDTWGFDRLFVSMMFGAGLIFLAVTLLPGRMPQADAKPAMAKA
jgi:MFS family permease